MSKLLVLFFLLLNFAWATQSEPNEKRDCITILKEIEALEKEKRADTINRIGHFFFGSILYASDKELEERLKLLRLELQGCESR